MTTKQDAIYEWVAREFSAVPREWVQIIMERQGQALPLPMWGTLWLVYEYIGRKLWDNSRVMSADVESAMYAHRRDPDALAIISKAKAAGDWSTLEQYIREEMAGARCVLDTDGDPTPMYVYDIADEYVVGIHGAGWNFYDGVWDKLYDLCRMHWHDCV